MTDSAMTLERPHGYSLAALVLNLLELVSLPIIGVQTPPTSSRSAMPSGNVILKIWVSTLEQPVASFSVVTVLVNKKPPS